MIFYSTVSKFMASFSLDACPSCIFYFIKYGKETMRINGCSIWAAFYKWAMLNDYKMVFLWSCTELLTHWWGKIYRESLFPFKVSQLSCLGLNCLRGSISNGWSGEICTSLRKHGVFPSFCQKWKQKIQTNSSWDFHFMVFSLASPWTHFFFFPLVSFMAYNYDGWSFLLYIM